MEPLDPAKNNEGSGFSKRRLSSILKAPRKSARSLEQEQQENVMKCAKPVEKRNSRRVSFAPANDVLLFSRDAKNASPLQELITATGAATTQNRAQVGVTEEGSHQIIGMETLLNAPLHASQQWDKVTGVDFGEKTVMFSSEDAVMDMTQSHTINIGSEIPEAIPLENDDILPALGEKRFMGDKSTTLSTGRNVGVSAPLPCLDPAFENFLASLSKSSVQSTNAANIRLTLPAGLSSEEANRSITQVKTQRADLDKENQVPVSVSALMEKSLNNTRKIRESSYRSALCPEDDVSMDMTEVQTGRILGVCADDDNPFQCLFPTQDMYAHSQMKLQQSTITSGLTDPKDKGSVINPPVAFPHQRHKVSSDANNECKEKTIVFAADDEFMDMTGCHTVNIACGPLVLQQKSAETDKENRLLNTTQNFREPFKGVTMCPDDGLNMDVTEAQTDHILEGILDDPFQFLLPSQDMYAHCESLKKADTTSGHRISEALKSSNHKGMEASSLKGLKNQNKPDTENSCSEKTVRFSADDACMAVTGSPTVNITQLQPQSDQNFDFLPAKGKTLRFTPDDGAMAENHGPTVNTARNLASYSFHPGKKLDSETCGLPRNTSLSVHNLDPGFSNLTVPSSIKPMITSNGDASCPGDISMDMTEAQTGYILVGDVGTDRIEAQTSPGTDECVREPVHSGSRRKADWRSGEATGSSSCKETFLKPSGSTKEQTHQVKLDVEDDCKEKTVRFTADDALMDVTKSHTVNIISDLELQSYPNTRLLPANGEKTVRFSIDDAAIDVTRSHTVNIISDLRLEPHQSANFLQANGEKTVRFGADDAVMDMTQSHTVNIATDVNMHSHENVDVLLANGEKTVRFTMNDAAMDVTQSHTVNIISGLQLQPHQKTDLLASRDKTVRFGIDDGAMDVTQSHTVNIVSDFDMRHHQNVDFPPTSEEKTVRIAANNGAMDMMECLTESIPSVSASDSVLTSHKIPPIQENQDFSNEPCDLRGNASLSAHDLDQESKNLSKASSPWVDIKPQGSDVPSPQKATDPKDLMVHLKTQKPANTENEAPGLGSSFKESPVNTTMMDCPEVSASMDMTEAQTGCILGQTCTDEPLQCLSLTQDPNSDHLRQTGITSQRSGDIGLSNPDDLENMNVPDSLNSNKKEKTQEPGPITTSPISQDMEIHSQSGAYQDVDSQTSRQMSLADLQSKVRRLSCMINAAPSAAVMDGCTAPLHHLEQDLEKCPKDKTVAEPEPAIEMVNTEDNSEARCLTEAEHPCGAITATPFSSKTKQLMSRISLGGFKPKLPQKSKPDDSKNAKTAGEHTRTIAVSVANELDNFNNDVSDIYDEELGSYEDMSETVDTRSPQKSPEFNMVEPLEDSVFEEDVINPVQGQKRLLPEDKTNMEDQKRMKASCETVEMSVVVECDSNVTTAPLTAQTIDSSGSHTASIKCKAASESTLKQSLFESQLEDNADDVQKKLEDGTITVLELFRLFGIDFVIHNPRQSVLPGRLLSDTEATPMDLLKDKHISRPKQMVYETDVFNLTEKVEGLKVRMQDLDKPLKTVNRHLWEDMRYASEKELKSFGTKLKERNNFFRKTSKVQSHEMKEVLYSNLVQANLEEQQKLRGKIQEADEMIKTLDDCIGELEAELDAVEQGFEDKAGLKSLQEEMKRVTERTAEDERQISELEMQRKHNSSKVKRLQAEKRNLESHLGILNTMNEWKLREMKDNFRVYTFLHETMNLQLMFEKSNGNEADSEQKVTHITFNLELDDEKSQCHARLVHKLVSQYVEGESSWVEKYPTRRHVPKLLHDVSLVVSRCRLLGEELRLLKLWGGLRLDILNISCTDTKVHIVFSSLKKLSKFEVVFSICLISHLYVLQVESFKNIFGSTTIQQIEEAVASFTPAKNLLTKTVKRIHEVLLC